MGHSDLERPMFRGADRRASVRVVYETVAMIAEYDGTNFPPFSAFWEIRTKDLSATGIGFLSVKKPETERLVIMLGNPQANPILIEARVVHCTTDGSDANLMNKVGCILLKRLSE